MRAYITVLDEDAGLVPYFVRHYSRLGATLFPVIVYSDQPGELDRICDMVRQEQAEPRPLAAFPSADFTARKRDHFIRDSHPVGVWSFFADLDEFAETTAAEVHRLINEQPHYIAGRWLDRVAEGGKLAAIDPSRSLEKVFPCGTYTRRQFGYGDYVYVLSPRGPNLHHPNACGWGMRRLREVPLLTVHHFKYQKNVVERLQRRIERIDSLPTTRGRMRWRERVQKTLDYIAQHGGGVDPAHLEHVGNRLGI